MKNRSLLGILLILLGIGFLLEQFNIISFNDILGIYWPLILIVAGAYGLLKKGTSKTLNGLLVLFGFLFQVRNLNLININIYKLFWPIILIIIGFSILFSKEIAFKSRGNQKSKINNGQTSLEDYISELVIMGERKIKIGSQEFKGGKLTAIMGGAELDLRETNLYNNEATLVIDVIMGEAKIIVPENWRIENTGTPILGEFNINNKIKPEVDAPLLRIKFTVIMGEVKIK